jgi:L-alanine-DL-glutamate epimerase-like enolase superfamily enzyme
VPGIDGLAGVLARLPVRIDQLSTEFSFVRALSYPDGSRPSSAVRITGDGSAGLGEHVGWTEDEHHAFAARARSVPSGEFLVGEWSRSLAALPAYDRAALEAAAIDLSLRQNSTNLFRLSAIEATAVRYAVSFAAVADPVAEARSLDTGSLPLKVDADPAWSDRTWHALASLGTVAVIDFKLRGDARDCDRALRHLPHAWIEDPNPPELEWSGELRARYAADAALTSADALEALSPRPRAINVKPARMGGVLEALTCLERASHLGLACYIGGMFEVAAGRRQLLTLAALACPDAPNDIAPLLETGLRPPRLLPETVADGFGGGTR